MYGPSQLVWQSLPGARPRLPWVGAGYVSSLLQPLDHQLKKRNQPVLGFVLCVWRNYHSFSFLFSKSAVHEHKLFRPWIYRLAITLFCAATLSFHSSIRSASYELLFLASQVAIYVPLESLTRQGPDHFSLNEVIALGFNVGLRALLAIGLLVGWKSFTFQFSANIWATVLITGVLDALQWVIVSTAVNHPRYTLSFLY